MPWLGRLVSGLSLWAPGFDSKQVEVKLYANEMSMGQVSVRVLETYLVRAVLPVLHVIYLFIYSLSSLTNTQ